MNWCFHNCSDAVGNAICVLGMCDRSEITHQGCRIRHQISESGQAWTWSRRDNEHIGLKCAKYEHNCRWKYDMRVKLYFNNSSQVWLSCKDFKSRKFPFFIATFPQVSLFIFITLLSAIQSFHPGFRYSGKQEAEAHLKRHSRKFIKYEFITHTCEPRPPKQKSRYFLLLMKQPTRQTWRGVSSGVSSGSQLCSTRWGLIGRCTLVSLKCFASGYTLPCVLSVFCHNLSKYANISTHSIPAHLCPRSRSTFNLSPLNTS